jgi:hypothetical protein
MLNDDVEHPIPFNQALLWTHLWRIGSEELDQMGVAALEGMRGRPLATHPGLLFEPTECSAAQASWAVTMIFEFDASLVLASGDFILYASHDSELYVAFLADVRLKRTDFGPPVVELTNDDALVSFKSMSTPGESVLITLGKDGSQGIAPLLPSLDFPQCPACP